MAKNIDFMGAIFPDVPSVKLPQQGGGLVSFDDTTDATATADKILQGYTAYANGEKLVGTASGGITPSGTISITQNGQVDVTQYAIADVNVSGGASNVVAGTFSMSGYGGYRKAISIPYTGNGYPIAAFIFVDGGPQNPNKGFYTNIKYRAIGFWAMTKCNVTVAPTYSGSGDDKAVITQLYKNSTSVADSFAFHTDRSNTEVFKNANATSNQASVVRFKDAKTLDAYGIGSSNYGLYLTTFNYYVIYSE